MEKTLTELIELSKAGLIREEEIPVKRMQEEFCITIHKKYANARRIGSNLASNHCQSIETNNEV